MTTDTSTGTKTTATTTATTPAAATTAGSGGSELGCAAREVRRRGLLRPGRGQNRRAVPSATALAELSGLALLATAERYDAAGWQEGLDAVHTETERRAADHPADGLLAQLAGYVSLLVEDTEHDLADEAHTWSRALRRDLHRTPDPGCDDDRGWDGVVADVPAARAPRDEEARS